MKDMKDMATVSRDCFVAILVAALEAHESGGLVNWRSPDLAVHWTTVPENDWLMNEEPVEIEGVVYPPGHVASVLNATLFGADKGRDAERVRLKFLSATTSALMENSQDGCHGAGEGGSDTRNTNTQDSELEFVDLLDWASCNSVPYTALIRKLNEMEESIATRPGLAWFASIQHECPCDGAPHAVMGSGTSTDARRLDTLQKGSCECTHILLVLASIGACPQCTPC